MSKTTPPNYRVSLRFVELSDGALDEFTNQVIGSLTGNPSFPTPPVLPPDLTDLDEAFRTAIKNATGDPQLTAVKDAAREALLDALRKDAAYVQSIANHDLAMLLSSGFAAASKNRAQSPLDTPIILGITNGTSGQLTVQVQPVLNAKSYEIQTSTAPGVWTHADTFPNARHVVIRNLTPGLTYTIQARAVGGSNGHSNWSESISHMAT